MLTLGAGLTSALKTRATEACYLLNLYYNDDDAVTPIRLSDVTRTVGGNTYIGIVRSWGSLQQSADIIEFSASMGKVTIILDNTEHALLDGRFSDLRATKNFGNRKWELYLSDAGQISTDPIGCGRISSDIDADEKKVTLHLLNNESKFDLQLPNNVVNIATYAQAPDKNIDKPIPMTYGSFDRKSATGSPMHYDYAWVNGHFPAIITDKQTLRAKPDTVEMKTMRTRNLYMASQDRYIVCDDGNVGAVAATPEFTFAGDVWYIAWPIIKDDSSMGNLWDEDIATSGVLASEANGDLKSYVFDLPPMEDIGTYTTAYINFDYSAKSDPGGGAGIEVYYQANSTDGYGTDASKALVDMAADFSLSPAGSKLPTMGAKIKIDVTGNLGTTTLGSLTCLELTIVFKLQPSDTFVQKTTGVFSTWLTSHRWKVPWWMSPGPIAGPRTGKYLLRHKEVRNVDFMAPANLEYVYFAGEGRLYGAWVDADSRNNGYNEDDLISNPIYIVEHTLRTEGSKATADIDITSFDAAGNTTDGLIGDVFNDAVSGILFAFSQYKFIDMMSFCEKVGHQCGALFFISGNGKMKVAVRRRPADYSANDENMKIDYDKIKIISWNETPINQVRNDITVRYAYDYALEETTENVNSTGDATSQGDTISGYNQTLYLEEVMDCCLNALTADDYADALLAWHKDRHNTMIIESDYPLYQALEIGDVIIFANWPSTLKINGTALAATDFFMVTDITKSGPSKVRIEIMEVS